MLLMTKFEGLVVQQQKRGIRRYLFFCCPYFKITSPSVIDYRRGSNALPEGQ